MAEKLEWMTKIRACIETASPGDSSVRSSKDSGSSVPTRSGTASGSSSVSVANTSFSYFITLSPLPQQFHGLTFVCSSGHDDSVAKTL